MSYINAFLTTFACGMLCCVSVPSLATFIYLGFVFQMAYIAFLATFTYVVLVKTLPVPRVQEYYVMAYILTAAIEKVREVRFTYVQ